MTMHKRHPQRCLHSHICKWNKDNCQDCIDTDCASHRYIYNPATPRDTVVVELEKELSERIERLKKMPKTETQLACWGECEAWWVRIQELKQEDQG